MRESSSRGLKVFKIRVFFILISTIITSSNYVSQKKTVFTLLIFCVAVLGNSSSFSQNSAELSICTNFLVYENPESERCPQFHLPTFPYIALEICGTQNINLKEMDESGIFFLFFNSTNGIDSIQLFVKPNHEIPTFYNDEYLMSDRFFLWIDHFAMDNEESIKFFDHKYPKSILDNLLYVKYFPSKKEESYSPSLVINKGDCIRTLEIKISY